MERVMGEQGTVVDQARAGPPLIGDYAAIGNMRTAALVSREGSIDWWCWPRFDSPAVLCRLLDEQQGGSFWVRPTGGFNASRSYLQNTNVLETVFVATSGTVRVTDCIPFATQPSVRDCWIIRKVEGLTGEVELAISLSLTPDFARVEPGYTVVDGGVIVTADEPFATLESPGEFRRSERGVEGRLTVRSGEVTHLLLALGKPRSGASVAAAQPALEHALAETVQYWREWCAASTYRGPHSAAVLRSGLTLKLLTDRESGGIIASPTTSLPEQIGGVRNWDYRYVWLRDAALSVHALQKLGHHDEAMALWRWLESAAGAEQQLKIVYRMDFQPPLPEQQLAHLSGYRGSKPLRVGNAAGAQLQTDTYGYVIDSAWLCQHLMNHHHTELSPVLGRLADQAATRWLEPDHGIWEVRGPRRQYVHSKVMCWVALDRALQLNARGWLPGDAALWRAERDRIHDWVTSEGFDSTRGVFLQCAGSPALDASSLLLATLGFIDAADPRFVATVRAVEQELGIGELVLRYRSEDGLPGDEGAFFLCGFWLVDALAQIGALDRALANFDCLVGRANDVGLLSEEVDVATGALLGNFPQGFSHLGLIHSALLLSELHRSPQASGRSTPALP